MTAAGDLFKSVCLSGCSIIQFGWGTKLTQLTEQTIFLHNDKLHKLEKENNCIVRKIIKRKVLWMKWGEGLGGRDYFSDMSSQASEKYYSMKLINRISRK